MQHPSQSPTFPPLSPSQSALSALLPSLPVGPGSSTKRLILPPPAEQHLALAFEPQEGCCWVLRGQRPTDPVPVLPLHAWAHTTPRTPQTRSTGKGWDPLVFPKKMPHLPPGLSWRSGVTTLTSADPMALSSHTCAGKPPAPLNPVGTAVFARALGAKWMMYPSSTQQCRLVTMMYGVRSSLLHLHCNPRSAFIKREEKPVRSTSIMPSGESGRIFVWSQSCFSHDTEGQQTLWAIRTRVLPGFQEPKSLSEVFVIISFKCCSGLCK